jgi:hypothetical protein
MRTALLLCLALLGTPVRAEETSTTTVPSSTSSEESSSTTMPQTVAIPAATADGILVAQLRAQLLDEHMRMVQAEARATDCGWRAAAAAAQARITEAAAAVGIADPSAYTCDAERREFTAK